MSTKTLTSPLVSVAQGTSTISSKSYGYTTNSLVYCTAEAAPVYYPIAAQFTPAPDSMAQKKPTGFTLSLRVKRSAAISTSYDISCGGGTGPSASRAREYLIERFKQDYGIECWPAGEKNDHANGIFSCKSGGGSTYLCPDPTVSNVQTYQKSVPYIYDMLGNPIVWTTVWYISGSCSLDAGTYTVSWQSGANYSGRPDVNGAVFWTDTRNWTILTETPQLYMYYEAGLIVSYTDEPGGYIDRTAANTFRWHTTWTGFPVENVAQTSATLQWKDGSSGTVNDISISGSATSYTMAADTLPASGELYWRVQATTASGTATSEWRALRTVDTPAVATPISPDGAYVDGTKTARFVWDYATASGTAPTGYDLQVKGPLDADFYTIKSEMTSATYAEIAPGTLPGGNLQWRVRAYNQSSAAGDWSAPLSCVVIAAPNAPEVWVESATPRPTIGWSAVGQLGYQVRVSGQYDSGTRFGTEKTFKIPEYLEYNTFDALDGLLPYTSEETNGITYTWSNKMCTLTGTATGTASNSQFSRRALPENVHPGDVWYLKFVTNSTDIICSIWFYNSSNTTIERLYPRRSTAVTIPAEATQWRMYIYVASGVSFADEPGVISDLRFLSSDSGQSTRTPIEVRVLGEYDLWSPWGSTNAQILSDGTIPLLLTGEAADGDASLSWDAVTGAEKYEILRLGKKIAETTATAYTDRYAVGSATYRVRACLASDAYTLSNSLTLTLSVASPRLTALDGDWIRLDKYTNPLPAVQITASRDVTLTQYAGVEYPVAEVGPHRTRMYVCNPAFSDHASAAAFEQLLGRPVFVKDQYGNSLYGVMTSVQRSSQRFYTELTAMIQEIGGLDL